MSQYVNACVDVLLMSAHKQMPSAFRALLSMHYTAEALDIYVV